MPKSRRRRKKPQTTTVRMSPRLHSAMEEQLEAFRRKFGREPGPGDPVFFDPDFEEPVPLSEAKIEANVLAAMLKAGTSPVYAYVYKRTGLLYLGGDRSNWPKEHIEEWDAVAAEYHAMEQAAQSKPDRH